MDGLTYTQAANHLTAAVSKLPDYQMACRVSNVKTGGGGGGGNKQGHVRHDGNSIYATDGTIWTGHYDEWATMKDADKEKITAERECKKKAWNGKAPKNKNYKRKVSDISSLTKHIQAMRRSVAEPISKRDETIDKADPKPPCNDAGNALGDAPPNSRSKAIEVSLFAQGPFQHSCCFSRILSSIRHPAASNAKRKPSMLPPEGRIDLDSHADTIVLGANCVILSHTGQSCEVMPYSDTYDAITDVPVVTGATLWTSLHDRDEYILIFNKALWMGNTLQHTLVNPNQLRAYDTTIHDNPFASSPLTFEAPTSPTIPLTTMGTIIYCNTCAPSDHELSTLPYIPLSSSATWNSHNVVFPTHCVEGEEHQPQISSISSSANNLTSTIQDPVTFHSRLVSLVQVHAPLKSPDELPSMPTFQSKSRHSSVTPEDLSERWFISLKKAKDTIKNTTQRILHSTLLPLAQRYRADRMYERPRIRVVVYTDMMDGQHKSLDGIKYAQVFTTDFHFSAVYPIESKGYAGDALKQFIADFGVLDKIICDGSKEQTKRGTTFMEQVRKHHIDIHTTGPN